MARTKFKFNPETLSYDKIRLSAQAVALKIAAYFIGSLIIAAVYYVIWAVFVDSPKEKLLRNEISQLTLQYELIQKEMGDMEIVLDQLQETDDNLYRSIFEADPVSSAYRTAGTGGVRRYRELDGFSNAQLVGETTEKLDILRNRIYVQSKSYDELVDLAENKEEMLGAVPAIMPISNKDLKRTASGFGPRMHPIYKIIMMHNGMDFTAPTGTDIYATGDGKVIAVVTSQKGLGNYVTIDHGYGYTSTYAHMSGFNVRRGQNIKRGEVIGFVGSTGLSVAPHLHYEIKYNGNYVDPANFYFNDLTAEEYERMVEISSNTGQSFD